MTTTEMPRWRTDDLYASLNDPQLDRDLTDLTGDVQALETLFDTHAVRAGSPVTPAAADATLGELNAILTRLGRVRAFVYAFVTTDSRDEAAQTRMAALTTLALPLGPLSARLTAWLGGLDDAAVSDLLEQSAEARAHEHRVRRAAELARHQMTPPEEDLAARLHPASGGGWNKLHGNVSSTLAGEYRGHRLPVTALRALASDPDPQVRQDAYHAEVAAWKTQETVFAACLNGVKGEEGTLSARRGFTDPVAPSLISNGIDRQTLDAMQAAVVRSLPDFRRYFRAKARHLGQAQLDWWDLFAPVGNSDTHWDYEAGEEFVERQFRAYSPALGDFAARAFSERWIDAGPRDGKRSGAFCMKWQGPDSRILMNHDPSLDSVSTLAHELGHAYHNLQLGSLRPLQQETPMTLAETASIFCETIIQNAALQTAQGDERLYVLETQLMGHAQVVVDIHSRFLFEKAVFERRAGAT
ncbi:M3 family metallopeptidase [Deinococcus aquaticus]|uniref:M3 family metallopeptidase n=1 Tax=Deinococcus aquaticus TaxID=328692 RepID=UPI003619797F